MSGGFFEYQEYKIQQVAADLEDFILNGSHAYSDETMKELNIGLQYLKLAYTYAHRIDYLLESDDSEASFRKRLKEDLACIGCCSEISQTKCHTCGTMNLVQITESIK